MTHFEGGKGAVRRKTFHGQGQGASSYPVLWGSKRGEIDNLVAAATAIVISRADRKSQVRQYFGFLYS